MDGCARRITYLSDIACLITVPYDLAYVSSLSSRLVHVSRQDGNKEKAKATRGYSRRL